MPRMKWKREENYNYSEHTLIWDVKLWHYKTQFIHDGRWYWPRRCCPSLLRVCNFFFWTFSFSSRRHSVAFCTCLSTSTSTADQQFAVKHIGNCVKLLPILKMWNVFRGRCTHACNVLEHRIKNKQKRTQNWGRWSLITQMKCESKRNCGEFRELTAKRCQSTSTRNQTLQRSILLCFSFSLKFQITSTWWRTMNNHWK